MRTPLRAGLAGTLWVDNLLYDVRDRLSRHVDPTWLPVEVSVRQVRPEWGPFQSGVGIPVLLEHGCGFFGCALATNNPDVTLKLTTDPTEAAFAAWLLKLGVRPYGFVPFYGIALIRGAEHQGSPVYAIWRGSVDEVAKDAWYDRRDTIIAMMNLYTGPAKEILDAFAFLQQDLTSGLARTRADSWRDLNEETLGFLQDAAVGETHPYVGTAYEKYAEQINQSFIALRGGIGQLAHAPKHAEYLRPVGDGLWKLYQEGLLVVDLHSGNFGVRGDKLLVFDTGLTMPFHMRYAKPVEIPEI